ncbi:two-component system sensor histidine kinase CpxA [Pasteurellaceae bacterium RH1A]|nr:two-component system sensor histidine kinase CpxA [Pasteurellaceae bacterium RH1A]
MHLFNRIKKIRNYLAYQIFASFWFTFAILLGIAFILPHYDARIFSNLESGELAFYQRESQSTEVEYNLDEVFERGLAVKTPNGFDVILLEKNTGMFRGVPEHHLKAFQTFIFRADNPAKPLQRRFGNVEYHGPFVLQSPQREYYQYFLKRVDPQTELINKLFDSPWLMLLLLLLISTPVLLWLAWKIAKPVKALRISANAVATGNLAIDPRLETEGINELRKVGRSFNQMVSSLQNLRNYQQRLLSDISHELKTPLTRMQLAVSLIRRRNGESNELTRIENEIDKLNTMILDLLTLSRQQLGHHLTREVFTVNKIWEDVLENAKFETEQNGISLYVSQRIPFTDHHKLNGNQVLLASALENVIRNAQKYAKSMIKVTMYIDKAELIILVDDDGMGIPDGEYDQIFRPFYRVEQDRARQTGGTGLGLAIVANAIQQHKGLVQAAKSPIGGLRVEIRLPLWVE